MDLASTVDGISLNVFWFILLLLPYAWWRQGLPEWKCTKCQLQQNEGEWGTVNFLNLCYNEFIAFFIFWFFCMSLIFWFFAIPSFFFYWKHICVKIHFNTSLYLIKKPIPDIFTITNLMAFMFYIHKVWSKTRSLIHPHFSSFYYLSVCVQYLWVSLI